MRLEGGRKLYTAVRRGQIELIRQVLAQEHRPDQTCPSAQRAAPQQPALWLFTCGFEGSAAWRLAVGAGARVGPPQC